MSRLTETFDGLSAPHHQSVALEDRGGTHTFGQLCDRSSRVAQALLDRSLSGRRIGLLTDPSADWVVGFFGIVLSGNTAVALSPLHPAAERLAFVESSSCAAVLVSSAIDTEADMGPIPVLCVDELSGREARQAGRPKAVPPPDSQEALILFTSGTTGRPKGARLSHDNVMALARLLGRAWGFSNRDCLLHTLPLHHLHGIGISLMVSLLSGARTIMLPRFDAVAVWGRLSEATVLMAVPTQHHRLFDAYDAADGPTRERWREAARRLRLVTSGSAALPVRLGDRWRELSGHYPLERYGMTEVGIPLSNPLRGERRAGTVGKVLEGMAVRLVDADGREVCPGEPGEIQIKGPTVFLGYDGDDASTEAAFVDGWFKSGDTATSTEGGYIKILGRTSVDILKSGGYKLSALEIEEALRGHAAIHEVAVIGVPDDVWGEACVAVIVPAEGQEAALEEPRLRHWAKARLAPYKVPRRVILVTDLPKNALGKVVKSELKRQVLARQRDVTP